MIRHYDVTGKRCPAPYIEAGKWSRLKARLCGDDTWTGTGSGAGPVPTGSVQELARRVIAGEYGNGAERKRKLGARYEVEQKRVNELLSGGSKTAMDIDALARAVIRGNGAERRRRLGANYNAGQRRVNELLS